MDSLALASGSLAGLAVALFFVSQRLGRDPRKAPLVPYYIPWLGSALSIGSDPDGFIEDATRKYGEVFAVQLAGQKMHYITSPGIINAVYKRPQQFVFIPLQRELAQKVYAISAGAAESPEMADMLSFPRRHLAPNNVPELTATFAKHALQNIRALVDSVPEKGSLAAPLLSLTFPPAYVAAGLTIFGPTFPVNEVLPHLRIFDQGVPMLAAGMPALFARKTIAARTEVTKLFLDYLRKPHQPADLIAALDHMASDAGWSEDDRAKFLFGNFWPVIANAPYGAFWIIALQLTKRSEGLKDLIQEIDDSRAAWTAANPGLDFFEHLTEFLTSPEGKLPLLSSTMHEMLRYTTSSYSIRLADQATELLSSDQKRAYAFERGDFLLCITRSVHYDPEIYDDPKTYNPRRFMDPLPSFTKSGKEVPNYLIPFGGGLSICEGRHLATFQIKIMVILLLTHFHMEVDHDRPSNLDFDMTKIGFGIIRNKGDLNLRVRRREI